MVESSIASDEESLELEDTNSLGLLPYSFEPVYSSNGESNTSDSGSDSEPSEDGEDRTSNSSWCLCGHCVIMESRRECVCCREIPVIISKLSDTGDSNLSEIKCITEHPGFSVVCLNRWVLQTAYSEYRQSYGGYHGPLNEKYRYTAYRQLVRWCWRWLGREVCVVLPSCVVNSIRTTFPSTSYTGYSDP